MATTPHHTWPPHSTGFSGQLLAGGRGRAPTIQSSEVSIFLDCGGPECLIGKPLRQNSSDFFEILKFMFETSCRTVSRPGKHCVGWNNSQWTNRNINISFLYFYISTRVIFLHLRLLRLLRLPLGHFYWHLWPIISEPTHSRVSLNRHNLHTKM